MVRCLLCPSCMSATGPGCAGRAGLLRARSPDPRARGAETGRARQDVAFVGPNDEGVAAGCDSGHLCVWNRHTGGPPGLHGFLAVHCARAVVKEQHCMCQYIHPFFARTALGRQARNPVQCVVGQLAAAPCPAPALRAWLVEEVRLERCGGAARRRAAGRAARRHGHRQCGRVAPARARRACCGTGPA